RRVPDRLLYGLHGRGWLRVVLLLRDGWLICGIALGMLLGAELAYRGQAALRRAVARFSPSQEPPHPYADSSWFAPYLKEQRASRVLRWAPYVYFRRVPYRGRYINVDSVGHRYTLRFSDST